MSRPSRPLYVLLGLLVARCAVSQVPPEVGNLRWCAGTRDCLEWNAATGTTEYRIYRGTGGSLMALPGAGIDSCLAGRQALTRTGPTLLAEPQAGVLQWFLVTGANGSGEGSAGAGATVNADGPCCGEVIYRENFNLPDGSPWPFPWIDLGGTLDWNVNAGMGRWRTIKDMDTDPYPYDLSRLHLPYREHDVEALFTIRFGNPGQQGIGFGLRQNGGYLAPGNPPGNTGRGYAVFTEGFQSPLDFGVWYELNGIETPLQRIDIPGFTLQANLRYRVRFRVFQETVVSSRLQAKIWAEGTPEPVLWQISRLDNSIPQAAGGIEGFAIDSFSNQPEGDPPAHTWIDDIEIRRLCNPLSGVAAPLTVVPGLLFGEGPLWDRGALFFSDINADTIFRMPSGGASALFRTPSGGSNGLALHPAGDLLMAEQQGRRLSRRNAAGAVSSLADTYQGLRFNAPNDIAVRGDGTLWFTDPTYGMSGTREIPFNGLFRRAPDGTLTAEWQGTPGVNEPNGVTLAPDALTLYVSDTQGGRVDAWAVAPSGALSGQRPFASGITIPDGMCIDIQGNLYVASWGDTLEIFAPDGTRWGAIAAPGDATNCAFGGEDGRDLYVTTTGGLHRTRARIPGLPW